MRTVKSRNCFQELKPTATEWGPSVWAWFEMRRKPEPFPGAWHMGCHQTQSPLHRDGGQGWSRWVLPCLPHGNCWGWALPTWAKTLPREKNEWEKSCQHGAAWWGLNQTKAGSWRGWRAAGENKSWPQGEKTRVMGQKSNPIGLITCTYSSLWELVVAQAEILVVVGDTGLWSLQNLAWGPSAAAG